MSQTRWADVPIEDRDRWQAGYRRKCEARKVENARRRAAKKKCPSRLHSLGSVTRDTLDLVRWCVRVRSCLDRAAGRYGGQQTQRDLLADVLAVEAERLSEVLDTMRRDRPELRRALDLIEPPPVV